MKKVLLLGLVLSAALFLNSCASLTAVYEGCQSTCKASKPITPEEQYYIGRSVGATVLNKYSLYNGAPNTVSYLNKICSAITASSEMPYLYNGYHVGIIDTDEINAISTPGGHILISRGLLSCTDSEDAVAAVIAHEIAHIQLGHGIEVIKKSRKAEARAKVASAAGVVILEANGVDNISSEEVSNFNKVTSSVAKGITETGFSKKSEYKADENALILMNNAGYDPHAMVDMLTLISKKTGKKKKSGWSSTHPKPKARLKKVNKKLAEMELQDEFTYTDKENRMDRFERYMSF